MGWHSITGLKFVFLNWWCGQPELAIGRICVCNYAENSKMNPEATHSPHSYMTSTPGSWALPAHLMEHEISSLTGSLLLPFTLSARFVGAMSLQLISSGVVGKKSKIWHLNHLFLQMTRWPKSSCISIDGPTITHWQKKMPVSHPIGCFEWHITTTLMFPVIDWTCHLLCWHARETAWGGDITQMRTWAHWLGKVSLRLQPPGDFQQSHHSIQLPYTGMIWPVFLPDHS